MAYDLLAWGYNSGGELGFGDTLAHAVPEQRTGKWLDVSAGYEHGLGIAADGTLWGWGKNTNYKACPTAVLSAVVAPTQIDTGGSAVVSVAAGNVTSHFVKSDGTLWGWGYNYLGATVGTGSSEPSPQYPVQIGSDSDWSKVVRGRHHTFALKKNGTLWGWGDFSSGCLGLGGTGLVYTPTQSGTATWSKVAGCVPQSANVAKAFALAIRPDGTLWSVGNNLYGKLGLGDTADRYTWTQIGTDTWLDISAGRDTSIALRSDGTLWVWGQNGTSYSLGLGDTADRWSPTQSGVATDWLSLCMDYAGFAVKRDGALWAWGLGANYTGDGVTHTTPAKIGTRTDWSRVVGGDMFMFGLTNYIAPTFWTNLFGQREVL